MYSTMTSYNALLMYSTMTSYNALIMYSTMTSYNDLIMYSSCTMLFNSLQTPFKDKYKGSIPLPNK